MKCHFFKSNESKDPHLTCSACKGNSCDKSLSCNTCSVWDESQWVKFQRVHEELAVRFLKKCKYKLAGVLAKKSTSFFGFLEAWPTATSSLALSIDSISSLYFATRHSHLFTQLCGQV